MAREDDWHEFIASCGGVVDVVLVDKTELPRWLEESPYGHRHKVAQAVAMTGRRFRCGAIGHCLTCDRTLSDPVVFVVLMPQLPDPQFSMNGGLCPVCSGGEKSAIRARVFRAIARHTEAEIDVIGRHLTWGTA